MEKKKGLKTILFFYTKEDIYTMNRNKILEKKKYFVR